MQHYHKPIVLKTVTVCQEKSFLAGSVVDQMNKGGIYTTPQKVEHEDFSTGEMNFKWEEGSDL